MQSPVLGTDCESRRAIGDGGYHAIGDPFLVLSGTAIAEKTIAFNRLEWP